MLTPKMKRRIKQKLSSESPTVWIGKEGITIQIITEIKKQLDAREIIKAKIQKNALRDEGTENIAIEISQQSGSELVEVRGHTFILYKHKSKKQ
ncbi:MAG: YhbY family RNA-binding protein [Candidatus Bathyarchaeota archaeon]